ncbi:MAG: TolC family protein, partial [Gammaproteobacteria bacterium]|nr:TolC family protein [Gammaproteobacteria bacterium]
LELQYDLHLAIAAEVSRAYLQLCGFQAQRDVLLKIADQQQRIADAISVQRDYGEAGTTDLERADALTAEFRAQLPSINAQLRSLIYQLSVLTGQPPGASTGGLVSCDAMPELSAINLRALSSDLIRHRADVRYAERQYVIASKQQNLAALAIYPTFSLFGDAGPNTIDLENFSDNESLAFNLGGLVSWPLYTGGQIKAQSNIAKELKIQAEFNYLNTVLKALQDVEIAATRLIESKKELAARKTVLTSRQNLAGNLQDKYQAGAGSLLEWLNAEQLAMQSQLAELAVQSQVLQYSVALHKALGGGWLLFGKKPGS